MGNRDDTRSTVDFIAAADQLAPGRRVTLLVYSRDGAEVVPLVTGRPVIIGRGGDVSVRDGSLSRQHCRFELVAEEIVVEDLQSRNGTRLNGRPVQRAVVASGDEVQLGAITVSVHILAGGDGVPLGLESHDRFQTVLEAELVRARTFGRKLALLMVRAGTRAEASVARWSARVRRLLRPVDRLALYGPDTVEIALPEATEAEVAEIARAITSGAGEPALVAGFALFPDAAGSADELIEVARTATQRASLKDRVQGSAGKGAAQGAAAAGAAGEPIVRSAAMRKLYETVERLADSFVPVLLHGETGSGKEVVARAIHAGGPRRRAPLRCINCGAIPANLIESVLFGHEKGAFTGADQRAKGVFEEAEGGTVLLDEIGELAAPAQAALLRVLESKQVTRVGSHKEIDVDVRILAATHRDLEVMVTAGTFRQDLLYRLNTITLRIPPLRERSDEVEPLAEAFLRAAAKSNGRKVRSMAPDARALLRAYAWPGNVRELRNVVERAVVLAHGDEIQVEDLSEKVRAGAGGAPAPAVAGASPAGASASPAPAADDGADFRTRILRYEENLLLDALSRAAWNQTEAAKLLRIPLRTLVHKIRAFGLKRPG